jgi:ribonuclease HI
VSLDERPRGSTRPTPKVHYNSLPRTSIEGALVNCMRRGWYKKWRENGWLTRRKEPVANRDLWERLLQATQRHQEVLWRKVRGHSKSGGSHKSGNDRADELAVVAKKEAMRPSTPSSP